jgi:hypothetical protein
MASLRCTGNLQRWDVAMSEPVRSEPVRASQFIRSMRYCRCPSCLRSGSSMSW